MGGWLQSVSPWHWLVLGVVLVILEIFSPGVLFLWLGIAAGLVGLVLAVCWIKFDRPISGPKVAVIGGGPAALSCAYYLKLAGCEVKILTKEDQPGRWSVEEI